MSHEAMNSLVKALKQATGLKDDFIYYMPFEDYKNLPDPLPRTPFTVTEVQERIRRYPNPAKAGRIILLGYSRPAVRAGKYFYPRHGGRHDSRRRGQRV